MKHTVDKGLIRSKKGIPCCPRWFADNRLAIQFDETGVTCVEYRNPGQKKGNAMVFLKGLHDGFRYYLDQNKVTTKAEYANSTIWPFGIDSEWAFQTITLKHSVYVVNDSIVIKLVTPKEIPSGLKFKLEFNETFSFTPKDQNNLLFCEMGAQRSWEKWLYNSDKNVLAGRYIEQKQYETKDENDIRDSSVISEDEKVEATLNVFIGADFPIEHVQRNSKHILYSEELEASKDYCFVTSFVNGNVAACIVDKYKDKLNCIKTDIQNQFERYQKIIDKSPRLLSPYKELNNFFSLSPLYHESLKVLDVPGAIRAKTTNYWVWGWDGLTSNCASLYWGDKDFIRDMLRFYEKTAHQERGVAHTYRNDMVLTNVSDLPAQGIYITLLQDYYNATNDINEIEDRYEFAKKIYKSIVASEVEGTGFCEGISLFPDFPVYMKETGHDISAFNNTVFYCASRSMEYLASLMDDKEMSELSKSIFKKMERNFIKLFFDQSKGFIVNSIDAKTLDKRDCYSSNAIKWENGYCNDLFECISPQSMKFFEENFLCKPGIRPMPVWDSAFDGDANQLHSWWPVMGEYYMKLINENNRVDLINLWIGWVSYWTKRLTIPEGIPCYIDTDEPEHDKWDTLCGSWQAYSIRGWYQAAVHDIVGVGMDAGGITFYPYEGEELKLKGLHYLSKIIDIEMCGSGRYIESIEIDGQIIRGTNKLPLGFKNSKSKSLIKVNRVRENPYDIYVKDALGLEFIKYNYNEDNIVIEIRGSGTSRIKLVTSKQLFIELDSQKVDVEYNEALNLATVEVNLYADEIKEMKILLS